MTDTDPQIRRWTPSHLVRHWQLEDLDEKITRAYEYGYRDGVMERQSE